jgi:hypothetical protein
MTSGRLSRDPHEHTLFYYAANAKRFFQNTHNIDINSLYEPFL